MPGASERTQRIKNLNANWIPDEAGGDGRFVFQVITADGERHALPASPAAASAIVALSRADSVLMWDPENRTLIVANIVGRMPWTDELEGAENRS